MKNVAIRMEDDLHAQLSIIAQLADSSITEEIRQAIEAHIGAKRGSGDLEAKAAEVLEEIERDASARRDAIAELFGQKESSKPSSRSRKGTRSDTSAAS